MLFLFWQIDLIVVIDGNFNWTNHITLEQFSLYEPSIIRWENSYWKDVGFSCKDCCHVQTMRTLNTNNGPKTCEWSNFTEQVTDEQFCYVCGTYIIYFFFLLVFMICNTLTIRKTSPKRTIIIGLVIKGPSKNKNILANTNLL